MVNRLVSVLLSTTIPKVRLSPDNLPYVIAQCTLAVALSNKPQVILYSYPVELSIPDELNVPQALSAVALSAKTTARPPPTAPQN